MIDSTNPKDKIGAKKPNLHLVPSVLTIHTAKAMENGAAKFGPFNWRGNKVKGSIYISAALRHIHSYFDGEDKAKDSGVHHLGHAAACLGILLDAMETGNLVDDRPVAGKAAEVIERETIKEERNPSLDIIPETCKFCGAVWPTETCKTDCPSLNEKLDRFVLSLKDKTPPVKPHIALKCNVNAHISQHAGTYPCVECGVSPGEAHTTTCKRFWEKLQDECPHLRFVFAE